MNRLFGTAPQSQPNTQAQPGNIPATNNNPADPNNSTVPASSTTATATPAASPLDQYAEIWKPDANPKTPEPSLFANVTADSLQQAAKKNDFTKVLTPDMLAAINKGGIDGQNALIQVMQAMAQKGFGDSAFTTTQIVEQALAKQQQKFQEMLPSLIKQQTVTENLRSSNPIFTHPAAAPVLDMFKQQALQKYPNASAAEIQQMAEGFLDNFAQAAQAPKLQAQQQANNANSTDWSSFLEM